MATGSGIRIGDAEREATAQTLRENFAHGRLTMEEFQQRLDAAFAAKTDVDLAKLTGDLPRDNPYTAPWPPAPVSPSGPGQAYPPGSGQQPGQGGRARRPFALAGASMALVVLLLVMVVWLPFGGLPKTVLIVFAVFAVVRRFLRRIIGGGGPLGRRGR
jgi:hypothetical protein